MSRFLLPLSVLALFGHQPVTAQISDSLIGRRIRLYYSCTFRRSVTCRRSIGQVRAVDATTLRLGVPAQHDDLVIPIESIDSLHVSQGKRRNFWQGALLGAVGGAAIGGIWGSQQEFFGGTATGLGIVVGIPPGLLAGGLIGMFLRSDRWHEIPIRSRQVLFVPALGRLGFRISLAM